MKNGFVHVEIRLNSFSKKVEKCRFLRLVYARNR